MIRSVFFGWLILVASEIRGLDKKRGDVLGPWRWSR